ncbi:MAG: type 6 secretion system effector deamidase TecA [Planctomycetota bacterium]
MPVNALGAQLAQQGPLPRAAAAANLMAAVGPTNVMNYLNGVTSNCYDAVAFVRYLLGAAIMPAVLATTGANAWVPLFNFTGGVQWVAGAAIAAGTAVGFRHVPPGGNNIFHATIALPGNIVRGINSAYLGGGWTPAWDRNLATLIAVPGAPNVFQYGPNPGEQCEVWLSNL